MKIYLFLFVGLALVVNGCGGLVPKAEHFRSKARYGEMERYLEEKESRMQSQTTSDLWFLCTAYAKVKRYNKLFLCLDEMKDRIDRKEFKVVFLGFPMKDFRVERPTMLAQAYLELGDYQKTITYAEQALQAIQNKGYSFMPYDERKIHIDALTLIGLAYALSGDKEKALSYAREMEGLKTSYPYGLVAYEQYTDIAKINMAVGNYEKALQALKWDENSFGKAISDAVVGVIFIENNIWVHVEMPKAFMLNKVLLETGDIATAKLGLDNLLSVPQIAQNGQIYWMVLYERGRIAEMEKDHKLAIDLYGRAVDIIEEQRSTINTEVSKIGFIGDKQNVYSRIISLLFERAQYAEAFKYVERAKARALVDLLASRNQFTRTDTSRKKANELIARLSSAESENNVRDETIKTEESSKQRAIIVELKEELQSADPEVASLVTVPSTNVAEIQQLLPPDETLIEYYESNDSLFAFFVNRHGIKGSKLEKNELGQEIENFRKNIMNTSSDQFKAEGKILYEKLIQPFEKMISTNSLTIVPHGALHYLPFNVLMSGEKHLIDIYNIRVLPSASVMKFLKIRRKGHTGELIAFGNPDMRDLKYDLPFAQNEALIITKDRPNSQALLREKATETAAKTYSSRFRFVHFACHGKFNPDKPLDSGLMLSKDSNNDGILTVGELYDMQLNADLVTLSACETALGKISNGDDVVGFTRGFLYAGTNSIVSSLWQVDDKATSILMQQFYKFLETDNKRSALRKAQLKVKETYNAHPYYWAAFQITGSGE